MPESKQRKGEKLSNFTILVGENGGGDLTEMPNRMLAAEGYAAGDAEDATASGSVGVIIVGGEKAIAAAENDVEAAVEQALALLREFPQVVVYAYGLPVVMAAMARIAKETANRKAAREDDGPSLVVFRRPAN